jgi:hypothetical protein
VICLSRILYLHVGPRKTATSAIQNFLRQHDNSVVVYPKAGLEPPGSHHGLVYEFFGNDRNGKISNRSAINQLLKQIELESKGSDRNVVISSEALELKWSDVGKFANALLPHLSRTPLDVEIILACREHFSRAASWYNHRTRALGVNKQRVLPDEFLADHAAEICYEPLVKRLRGTGLRVTVLDYHPSETWTDRFFRHVGFRDDQLPRIRARHVAVSAKVLIAKIAAHHMVPSHDDRQEYLKAFMQMSESRAPSKFIFGRECAKNADSLFGKDREFLLKECGISLNHPDIETIENAFCINQADLEEIAAVAENIGKEGQQITEFARQYVRVVPT